MQKEPFKFDNADKSAGFLLWKMTALWQKELAEVLSIFDITQTQYAIMASLRWFQITNQLATQAQLAEHTKIDKMTLSKAIRKLELNGLIVRLPSHQDLRANEVCFTEKGLDVINRAIVAIENADDLFFSKLSTVELSTFKNLMLSLTTN